MSQVAYQPYAPSRSVTASDIDSNIIIIIISGCDFILDVHSLSLQSMHTYRLTLRLCHARYFVVAVKANSAFHPSGVGK